MTQSSRFFPPPETPRRAHILLEFALYYARKGLPVLPLHAAPALGICNCGKQNCSSAAKHPVVNGGVNVATTDTKVLRDWWGRYRDANVGIATGHGVLVIDLDPRHGGTLEALRAIVDLPKTETVQTGGGGLHLYFRYNPWLEVRNSAGKLAPGIDIRADGGYVVAPPSIHANGNRYYWLERPEHFTLAPDALLDLLLDKATTSSPHISVPTTVPKTPPHSPSAPTDAIPEGKRNSTLVSLAGTVRNWGANEEALFIVLQAMNQASCKPPLSEAEVRQRGQVGAGQGGAVGTRWPQGRCDSADPDPAGATVGGAWLSAGGCDVAGGQAEDGQVLAGPRSGHRRRQWHARARSPADAARSCALPGAGRS